MGAARAFGASTLAIHGLVKDQAFVIHGVHAQLDSTPAFAMFCASLSL